MVTVRFLSIASTRQQYVPPGLSASLGVAILCFIVPANCGDAKLAAAEALVVLIKFLRFIDVFQAVVREIQGYSERKRKQRSNPIHCAKLRGNPSASTGTTKVTSAAALPNGSKLNQGHLRLNFVISLHYFFYFPRQTKEPPNLASGMLNNSDEVCILATLAHPPLEHP